MDEGPLGVTPPDDSGSDTFRRYRYQAEVAFPFCLDCALIGDVVSVTLEHLEDLAVEFADGSWRLVQVKTRDPGQAPWTLKSLLGSDGAAFKSLLRTHRALAGIQGEIRLELRLEGAIRADDAARRLLPGGGGPTTDIIDLVAERLGIDDVEAVALLERTTLRDSEPSRDAIEAVNLMKLGLAAPAVSGGTVREVYRSVLEHIEDAMDRRLGATRWPVAVLEHGTQSGDDRAVIANKRLTIDILEPLFRPLGSTEPLLLKKLLDPDTRTSALEDKLAACGASASVIEDAKLLRANASIRDAQIEASSLYGRTDRMDDLRLRLRVVANAVAAEVGDAGSADRVWAVLQSRVNDQRDALDQHSLLGRDPCSFWARSVS